MTTLDGRLAVEPFVEAAPTLERVRLNVRSHVILLVLLLVGPGMVIRFAALVARGRRCPSLAVRPARVMNPVAAEITGR